MNRRSFLPLLALVALSSFAATGQINGSLFKRASNVSNFDFTLYNDGMLYGSVDAVNGEYDRAYWPRGTLHTWSIALFKGIAILGQRDGRLLVSDANMFRLRNVGPDQMQIPDTRLIVGNQMVPGRIGDSLAGYDPVFNGAGWQYVDDRDYVIYSSLDFDDNGVDVSGNNYNDWPLRDVEEKRTFVVDPLQRRNHPPVYRSDEDMFCVFKDTDTQADYLFTSPDGGSIPIGLEIQLSVYSWGEGPGKDIVIFQYDIFNKSEDRLDSCYVCFGTGLSIHRLGSNTFGRQTINVDMNRHLAYQLPLPDPDWATIWTATPYPPTIGYSLLDTPSGYEGIPVGLTHAWDVDTITLYRDADGLVQGIATGPVTDSILYRNTTTPPPWLHQQAYQPDFKNDPLLLSGPFPMQAGEMVRYSVAFMFSDSLSHLLLLDDYIKRMHEREFQRPAPPPPPRLSATGLDRAVKLSWDTGAEGAVDEIIPDSLGRPFAGYRLLRAVSPEGPFTELGRWVIDTLLVHEFVDRGEDIGGLRNNVRYYYQVLAFDEGSPRLKLDPMETPAVDGTNSISVVPASEASDITATEGQGTLLSGELGAVGVPRLIPSNTTNYNGLFAERPLEVTLGASTDGVSYAVTVEVRDSVGGREQNETIDLPVMVHGSPETAGVKAGIGTIDDVFGLGGARLEFDYSFEQLPDSFRIETPMIESSSGADVPIIIRDSLSYTGLQAITPLTGAEHEVTVTFTTGGFDTLNLAAGRILPYLNVEVRDGETGELYADGWTMTGRALYAPGSLSFVFSNNRYYLTDTLENGQYWECSNELEMFETVIVFDFPDRGRGNGKSGPSFPWASGHREGTRDFQAEDVVRINWSGGRRGEFPVDAVVVITPGSGQTTEVTEDLLEKIRIVPNPYLVRHEAERGEPRIYFNYLPDECTIRIYTIALDLVKTIHHEGGSRAEWDLQTEGGQLVASQLFIAHIEAPNGKQTTRKFAVVVGG